MNRFISFFIACMTFATTLYAENAKPFVVPELKEWSGREGFFVPNEHTRVVYLDDALGEVAAMFADDYAVMFGVSLEKLNGRPKNGDIVMALGADDSLGQEGYTVDIDKTVRTSANDAKGVYWATRTLLQICEQTPDRRLPKGFVSDFPDYAVRGMVLDCGRKFIPFSYLGDLVKIMSYYKMNVLHVHLNDNGFKQYFDNDWNKTYSAFRLECESFPGLTARDGHYTKREFVDFQTDAACRFVEIIPEIDAPAHTLAFSRYNPALGSEEYGMDHLDLSAPEVYSFMDSLFAEYLGGEEPVFVGPRVHIGTDEYSNKDKAVVERFRAFTDRYIRYVESFGKQACVWGALTHADGDTPVKADDVVMYAWYNGYADPAEMARRGYKLVSIPDRYTYIVPMAGYYYDYLNTRYLYDEWTPAHVADAVFPERDSSILGGMFALWNDVVGNGISVKDIHHRIMPALQTVAAKTWNVSPALAFDDFEAGRGGLSEAPGVNQSAKIGDRRGLVYEAPEVVPGARSPYSEIGYGYTVTFDMEARPEEYGTELFRSPYAVFYLSDPVSGMFGFARDGYLNTFGFRPYDGEKISVKITGDSVSTSLFVDGKLVERMGVEKRYLNGGTETQNSFIRTLVFPLEKAGDFKSRITNLKVYNYIVE